MEENDKGKHNIPRVNCQFACIVSDECDFELIAAVLLMLAKNNTYCPVFRMPKVKHKRNSESTLHDDDYLTNVIAHVKGTHINNAMARVHTETIVCVGLDDFQLSYFNLDKYYNVKKVYINNSIDFINEFGANRFIELPRNESIVALSLYKSLKKVVQVNSAASVLIIAERSNDMSELVISNYAASIGADLKFISSVSREEVNSFYDDLLKWKLEKTYGAYLRCTHCIHTLIGDIDLESYKYVTFFTRGIPYGVFCQDITICTHVIIPLNEDVFIFNNLVYEMEGNKYDSAVVFSPEPVDLGYVTINEANEVDDSLQKKQFYVKKLYRKHATVKSFDQYVGYYPFDILHIVSHGGEVSGYYVNTSFTDRMGISHNVEFEEIVGFAFDNTDYVNVSSKRIFRYFDGYKWMSPELKSAGYPEYVYNDMMKSMADEDAIAKCRVKVDYLIEKSCHVQCYDGIHQGQFHSIASNGNPIVFNNSCTSWRDFSATLIASGCRGYIGTLWNIENSIALHSATVFYQNVFCQPISDTVNLILRSITKEEYEGVYIYCGLHFSTIKGSSEKKGRLVLRELMSSLERWVGFLLKTRQSFQVSSALNTIKFLCAELSLFYRADRVVEVIAKSLRLCSMIEKREDQRNQKETL